MVELKAVLTTFCKILGLWSIFERASIAKHLGDLGQIFVRVMNRTATRHFLLSSVEVFYVGI